MFQATENRVHYGRTKILLTIAAMIPPNTFTGSPKLNAALVKPYLHGRLRLDWPFGLALILGFGALRGAAVLYGIQTGNNQYLSLVFLAMIVLPFAVLSRAGRRAIGIRRPRRAVALLPALLVGGATCFAIFLLGQWLYGESPANWFRYIGESYPLDFATVSAADKRIYFFVFVLIGMSFSPLGEELLYRGLVHRSFVPALGDRGAALVDSAAFGLTHLAHFGIVYLNDSWTFLPVPALLWVTLMFLTGLAFNSAKAVSGSIWGAVLGHMAFNITMTYLIFYIVFA